MSPLLTIETLGARGDGIAMHDGQRVHIAYTLPGETIEAQLAGERGELIRILTPSPDRQTPECRHFGTCGGCAVQHWRADSVAEWKRQRIETALRRVGLSVAVAPTLDAHGEGRRRVVLHIRAGAAGYEAGFMRARSHQLVDIDHCPLLVPALARAPDIARRIGHALRGLNKPLDLQATATDQGLDLDLRGAGKLPEALHRKLIELAVEDRLARLTLHGERILEASPPSLTLAGAPPLTAFLPPGAFLQASTKAEALMAEHALSALAGAKSVLDLFCGLGPFALHLARAMRVAAFDADKPAIEALNRSIRANPGLKPVSATARDLFRQPLYPPDIKGFDAALLDPPRQGAEAQVKQIAASKLERLVYIACDPESFARDARILADAGFAIASVRPIDQFRYAPHIELISVMTRAKRG